MLPFLIPLIASGITSLGQAAIGYNGRQKALSAAEDALSKTPHATIPEATKNALANASASLNAESPAIRQLYDQMLKSEATAMNNAERNAPSGAAALSVASNVHQGILDKMPTIAQMNEQYLQQNKANYYNALNEMGKAEQIKQQRELDRNNQILDFQLGKAGANSQMLSQGIQGLASIATNPYMWNSVGKQTSGATVLPQEEMSTIPLRMNTLPTNSTYSKPFSTTPLNLNPILNYNSIYNG